MSPDHLPPADATSTDRLVELRVLDGPNVHLARPAIQLRLDVGHVLAAPTPVAAGWARLVQLRSPVSPGDPGSEAREAFAQRLVKRIVRLLAARTGIQRLRVEAKPGWVAGEVMATYPWQHLGPAEELGRWVACVLDDLRLVAPAGQLLPGEGREHWEATLATATARVGAAESGDHAHVQVPGVPAIGVTGTNGKTTTTRLIAHLAMTAGLRTAWNSTDGVYVDGVLELDGDYAGFEGTGRVLATEGLEFAVLEMARGGLLRRGMGVRRLDVAVITNVTADHLGLMGIDTLDQLAEVKSIPVRSVRRGGWAVLNADDPRVLAMREVTTGRVCVFSLDAQSPGVRDALRTDGRAITVIDGHVALLRPGADPDLLIDIADVPLTLGGLATHNVANVLAAAGAALGAGIDRAHVVAGLRTFLPDPAHNPSRLNVWRRDGVTIVVDLAHNEASYTSLLAVCRGLCPPSATLRALAGTVGDRTPEIMQAIGEVTARAADEVVFVRKHKYLRDADADEVIALLQAGAASVGKGPFEVAGEELEALDLVLARALPGDVVAFAVHDHLYDVTERMQDRGAVPIVPSEITDLVRAAR